MAHNLDDPEFWLPPLFPYDDELNKTELPLSEANSGFSSPVDSSKVSTETENGEDEFLTELTRKLTNSTHLSHDLRKAKQNHGLVANEEKYTLWKMPTSPQSKVAKITRLQQDDTMTGGYIQFRGPPEKPCLNNKLDGAYHSNQRILYQNGNSNGRALGLSPSAWPTLQQSQSQKQPLPVSWTSAGTGVFLPRECSGTGVFLPRPVSATPARMPRRKHPVALKQRNVLTQSQQRRDMSRSPRTINNEIRLPQEWTY